MSDTIPRPLVYDASKLMGRSLTGLGLLNVSGQENLPAEPPYIVAPTHRGPWDFVATGVAIPERLRFVAKKELFEAHPLLRNYLKACGVISVDREDPQPDTIVEAAHTLGQRGVVGIFPEGKFGTTHIVERLRRGVGLIASIGNVTIVPVGIAGAEKRPLWMIPRRMHAHIGEPVTFEPLDVTSSANPESLTEFTRDRLRHASYITRLLQPALQEAFDSANNQL